MPCREDHVGDRHGSYGEKWDGKDYPQPYTAQSDNIASIHQGRLTQSVTFKLCGTCGEPVQEELVGIIVRNPESRIDKSYSQWGYLHSESGPYHLKCLALNFTMCPHLAATSTYMPAVALWSDVKDEIKVLART